MTTDQGDYPNENTDLPPKSSTIDEPFDLQKHPSFFPEGGLKIDEILDRASSVLDFMTFAAPFYKECGAAHLATLMMAYKHDGKITQIELRRHLNFSKQALTRHIKFWQEKGFMFTREDPKSTSRLIYLHPRMRDRITKILTREEPHGLFS